MGLVGKDVVVGTDVHVNSVLLMKGIQVETPANNNETTILLHGGGAIIAPVSPRKKIILAFPRSADGHVMFISFTQDIDCVVFTNGNFANQSTIGPQVKAGDSITLFYHQKADKWFKIGGSTTCQNCVPKSSEDESEQQD